MPIKTRLDYIPTRKMKLKKKKKKVRVIQSYQNIVSVKMKW